MRKGLVVSSVVDRATPPSAKAAQSPEMSFWTPAELHVFMESLDRADLLHTMRRMLAFTGLRRGEVAGLRWQDVDLTGDDRIPGRTHVRQQYKLSGEGGTVFEPAKSTQVRRTVDLDPATSSQLQEHRRDQLEEWDLLGLIGEPELVFTNLKGAPVRPDSGISKRFDRLVARTGLPRIRLPIAPI